VAEAAEPAAVPPVEAAADSSVLSAAPAATATATEPEAEKWEEIWRPRRRGRTLEAGAERHKRPQRPQRPERAHDLAPKSAPHEGKGRPRRHGGRRNGPGKRGDELQRLPLQASSPSPKAAAFDPDSPFAALSSLKAAMEKRSQE
jgi:ATP-dependent RNA helicase SUPV3L1/SUV3